LIERYNDGQFTHTLPDSMVCDRCSEIAMDPEAEPDAQRSVGLVVG
jgi:hypothetical protein